MSYKKFAVACFAGAAALAAGFAHAEDEPKNWHFTVSAKGWSESWSTWQNVSGSVIAPGTTMNTGDTKTAFIGGATVRYKDFFVSGNVSPATDFYFTDLRQTNRRSESDVNVGFYLHPQVGISLGSKRVKIDYGAMGTGVWDYKFVTLGLNASASINETQFFVYENGAVSLNGTATLPYVLPAGITTGKPKYQSLEAGFGFRATNNFILTAGYKFQQIELPATFAISGLTEKTRDTTTGFIFGAAYTF